MQRVEQTSSTPCNTDQDCTRKKKLRDTMHIPGDFYVHVQGVQGPTRFAGPSFAMCVRT